MTDFIVLKYLYWLMKEMVRYFNYSQIEYQVLLIKCFYNRVITYYQPPEAPPPPKLPPPPKPPNPPPPELPPPKLPGKGKNPPG